MLRATLASLLALSAFTLAGCSADEAAFDGSVQVGDDYFEPEEATLDAGTEIHFEVEPSAQNPHTVTIHKVGDPVTTTLLNRTVQAGQDVHFTFASAGTYHVWCRFHGTMTSGMAMLVTVE